MSNTNSEHRLGKTALTVFRVLFTFCLIGTIIFIFYNSSKIGSVSAGKSGVAVEKANNIMSRFGFEYRFSEHLIRKTAHVLEYTLLGFWLMLTLRIYTKRILAFISWPILLGLLTAVLDEFYQTFVPGRSGRVEDVVIDLAGILAGLFLGLFILLLFSAIWNGIKGKPDISNA